MSLETSKAYRFVLEQGWAHRVSESSEQVIVEVCPFCQNPNSKFFMSYGDEKDGLCDCKVCHNKGNLFQLRQFLGLPQRSSTVSLQDAARSAHKPENLPDFEAAHKRLMAELEKDEAPAIDFLVNEKGFSIDVIERMKIGLGSFYSEDAGGEVPAVLYPYLTNGKIVFHKYRSIGPVKDFRGSTGRESRLYNEDAVKKGLEDLILCEGEGDVLAALTHGIENVVGVPGAGNKKFTWLKKIDDAAPFRIYTCFDNDAAGVKGAKALAERIGVDKCYNIQLPTEIIAADGEITEVKDLTEWFKAGGTREQFEKLKAEARQFEIDGVVNVSDVVQELIEDCKNGVSTTGKYWTPWEKVNKLIGGFNEGDLIGLLAPAKTGKTTFAMNLLDHLTATYGESSFLYCLEMLPKQIVRKWVSMATYTDDKLITSEVLDTALSKAANYPADLLFGYSASKEFKAAADVIRQTVRRYGCKFIVFDNLQILMKGGEHWAQDVANLSSSFKALAMELKVVMFLVIQPKGVQDGVVTNSTHAYGSSLIQANVDAMFCLHRNPMTGSLKTKDLESIEHFQMEASFSPVMFVNVDRSRFSSGGSCGLHFDGARSLVLNDAPPVELDLPTPVIDVPWEQGDYVTV